MPEVAAGSIAVLAGVDAQGATRLLRVNEDGTLSGAGGVPVLSTDQAQLAGDVSMTNANEYYDGPSLSLPAGVWLVVASISASAGTGGNATTTMKVHDGTNNFASAVISSSAGFAVALACVARVTLGSTTAVKASVACDRAGGVIRAAATANPAGNTASTLSAVRVG